MTAAGLIEKLLDGYERRGGWRHSGARSAAPTRTTETSFGNGTSRWATAKMALISGEGSWCGPNSILARAGASRTSARARDRQ